MNIYESISETVGNTPMVRLANTEKEYKISARLLAKIEGFNPTGSAKDRAAMYMISDAEEKGLLRQGGTIIEPTSGNTGIGLAAIAVPKGYRVIIVMPDTMSIERQKMMTAYGAELVLTEGRLGMTGAIAEAERLCREIEGSFIPDQFKNPANALAHYKTTGPEIWRDTEGQVDVFVAGIGTGGTISGVGRFLKEMNPDIRIIGVEPAKSPFLTKGTSGAHGLQGIGAGFLPEALDLSVVDEIITVDEEDAYCAGRLLGNKEGILAGISSGAALHAALTVAHKKEYQDKSIVVLLPDTGTRYLSTEMF